jgi:hypothetical protein
MATELSPKAQRAEEARLARYFRSIAKHAAALRLAVDESFGGELDAPSWRNAFDSSDPTDTLRTVAVTDSYSAVVNACVEILKAASGARLLGLLPHRRPHAGQAIKAAQEDGGLTPDQATLVNNSYVLEGVLHEPSSRAFSISSNDFPCSSSALPSPAALADASRAVINSCSSSCAPSRKLASPGA